MISANYQKDMAIALPGQVSDTSRYNVDGACVLMQDAAHLSHLPCGLAVHVAAVGADGVKEVQQLGDGKVPYGVLIRSHYATHSDANGQMCYYNGDGANVLTTGRVWMVADSDFTPTFGTPVKLDNMGRCKETGAIAPTGWTYAGGKTAFPVLGTGNKGEYIRLLEVQLHQL